MLKKFIVLAAAALIMALSLAAIQYAPGSRAPFRELPLRAAEGLKVPPSAPAVNTPAAQGRV